MKQLRHMLWTASPYLMTMIALSSALLLSTPALRLKTLMSPSSSSRDVPGHSAEKHLRGRVLLSTRGGSAKDELHQQQQRGKSPPPSTTAASPGEADQALKFLLQWMPAHDKDSLPDGYLEDNVAMALEARHSSSWAAAVPLDIFNNYVLPYASLSEKREEWRGLLGMRLGHLIEGSASTLEAGAALNKGMWDILGVKFVANQAPAIMSVHETLQHGYASCSGLSILLVAACRSLGVPARVAGTPEWNRPEGGNHNWVEVYDDATGTWKFTGAAEWSGWDQGWFFPQPAKAQVPRDLMHAIYATSWEMVYPGATFPLFWNLSDHSVRAVDVTDRYLKEAPVGGGNEII